jgi:hypothetical protein
VAQLLPADFDLTQLEHSERRTCQSFLDGLDDSWFVVPKVPVLDAGKVVQVGSCRAGTTFRVVTARHGPGQVRCAR